jgi:hypothetical protein
MRLCRSGTMPLLKPLLGAFTAPALSKMFSLFCHKEEKELTTTAYDHTSGSFWDSGPDPLVRGADADPDLDLAPDPSPFS